MNINENIESWRTYENQIYCKPLNKAKNKQNAQMVLKKHLRLLLV